MHRKYSTLYRYFKNDRFVEGEEKWELIFNFFSVSFFGNFAETGIPSYFLCEKTSENEAMVEAGWSTVWKPAILINELRKPSKSEASMNSADAVQECLRLQPGEVEMLKMLQ